MSTQLHAGLVALGNSAVNKPLYEKQGVDKTVLERFPNPFVVSNVCKCAGTVAITAPEMTSLCPLTGQPDFCVLKVEYQPDQWCVESKSFKLYIGSFRNEGEFHESVVNRICNDLVELLSPTWLRVVGEFTPRGGISFWPTAIYHAPANP